MKTDLSRLGPVRPEQVRCLPVNPDWVNRDVQRAQAELQVTRRLARRGRATVLRHGRPESPVPGPGQTVG